MRGGSRVCGDRHPLPAHYAVWGLRSGEMLAADDGTWMRSQAIVPAGFSTQDCI
jgi:hypothetical protein